MKQAHAASVLGLAIVGLMAAAVGAAMLGRGPARHRPPTHGDAVRIHHLKAWPEYFDRVWSGRKHCELRRDDRGFAEGDHVLLREWDPRSGAYTGREVEALVTDVVRDARDFGLEDGFAALSLGPPRRRVVESYPPHAEDQAAGRPTPRAIFFFPDGTAAVFDQAGRQMPRYQRGLHRHAIDRLAEDGTDWRAIPEIQGTPIMADPPWWDADHEARCIAESRPEEPTP